LLHSVWHRQWHHRSGYRWHRDVDQDVLSNEMCLSVVLNNADFKCCWIQDEQFEAFRRVTFQAAVQCLRLDSVDTANILLDRMVCNNFALKPTRAYH